MAIHMHTQIYRRAGFTLTELLTVIAIIGVLVALLLPAVQTARESARRSSCLNNIKQASLGLITYQSAKGRFPRALVCRSGTDACWLTGSSSGGFAARSTDWGESWLIRVLPFMELTAITDRYDFTQPNTATVNKTVATNAIPTMTCASRTVDTKFFGSAYANNATKIHYGANFGAGGVISETLSWSGPLRGVFDGGRQWGASLAEILDGTTKTLLLGEIITDTVSAYGKSDTRGLWNYQGSTAFSGGLGSASPNTTYVQAWMRGINSDATAQMIDRAIYCPNMIGTDDKMYYCKDGSMGVAVRSTHPGGANVAMADGSARFVNESIDILTWYRLHTIQGGETVGEF